MKILVIDRDELTSNLLKSKLSGLGHKVEIHANKTAGLEDVVRQGWDVIFLDPLPITNPKSIVMDIRRYTRRNVYLALMSESLDLEQAYTYGFNNAIPKPFDMSKIEGILDAAEELNHIVHHLGNDQEDYPSAGGVISKSAFNQLFLSCLDRADRYGETANVIYITFENYNTVAANDGVYEADTISAKMARQLVNIRRQSDIIAQIRKNEYAVILLRPLTEAEPMDAANRFAETLSKCTDLPSNPIMDVDLKVQLMSLPDGKIRIEHAFSLRQN